MTSKLGLLRFGAVFVAPRVLAVATNRAQTPCPPPWAQLYPYLRLDMGVDMKSLLRSGLRRASYQLVMSLRDTREAMKRACALSLGRGWLAAGAFSSRCEPGLRPPKVAYAPELQRRSGSCPQAGEGLRKNPAKKHGFMALGSGSV